MVGSVGQSNGAASNAARELPPITSAEVNDLKSTGFRFSENGVSWDQWINTARASKDPALQAQYKELVDLAGGRTDNVAIKVAMERVQSLMLASRPEATATEKAAAIRGWEEQLTGALRFANPVDLLSLPLEHAARALANDPAIAQTDWGKGLQAALQTTGQVRAFKQGLAEGIWEGGKSLVVGVVSMAAKTLRYGADNTALGSAGDALRGLTGKMPDWLEATIPSEKRGDATNAAIVNMGSGIKNYLANRTPGQVASDLSGAIGKAWEGLKADHAAAAAQGPEAEARWWGKTIGRIGFEVGATFIPIAGQAGKVSTVAKGADVAADTLRGADRLADMGRGAEAVGAVDKGADGLRAAETLLARGKRILGDLPLNSKTLDDLFQAGKLTMDEARALAKNAGWKDSSGRWIYPPNEGFEGIPNLIRLGNKDQLLIDRYGGPTGKFASPLGESYTARALPQGSNRLEFHVYKIVGDIEVLAGKATPWFDEAGGAIQYKFPRSMSDLIYSEKLVELRR